MIIAAPFPSRTPLVILLLLLFASLRGELRCNYRLVHGLSEEERMYEYNKRGYKWPMDTMVPDTPGWKRLLNRRFEQIDRIKERNDKYNGWLAFITSAIVATNYTQNGWGLTRAPEHITRRLQERLYATLGGDEGMMEPIGEGTRKEHFINVIEAGDHARPIMIPGGRDDNDEILREMQPMFEWWSGIDLSPSIAYGIRAYRNDSSLLMHVDKSTTHVISGIYHVDRSDDAEPWPIIIEDFQGNTNQVYLAPGDLLFYESSKCFHGRPQKFIGSYYASIFMHYRPAVFDQNIKDEIHYAVPEHWMETKPSAEGLDEMVVVGTSFKEPNCKNLLCSLDETNEQSEHLVTWHGPAPRGKIGTTGWDPVTMTPPMGWEEEGSQNFNGGKRDASEARRVLENTIENEL